MTYLTDKIYPYIKQTLDLKISLYKSNKALTYKHVT